MALTPNQNKKTLCQTEKHTSSPAQSSPHPSTLPSNQPKWRLTTTENLIGANSSSALAQEPSRVSHLTFWNPRPVQTIANSFTASLLPDLSPGPSPADTP